MSCWLENNGYLLTGCQDIMVILYYTITSGLIVN